LSVAGVEDFIRGMTGRHRSPEASTWAMMILGFIGIGFMAYRRRNPHYPSPDSSTALTLLRGRLRAVFLLGIIPLTKGSYWIPEM
jgi:hypothetical protein